MKYIKNFESLRAKSDEKFPFQIPSNFDWGNTNHLNFLMNLKDLPEFKMLKEVLTMDRNPPVKPVMTPDLDGSLKIHSLPLSTFKINSEGAVKYGETPIEPMSSFSPKTWGDLFDFITVYSICRGWIKGGGKVQRATEEFVFEGKQPSDWFMNSIMGTELSWVLVEIAKRRHGESVMRGSQRVCKTLLKGILSLTPSEMQKQDGVLRSCLRVLAGAKDVGGLADSLCEPVKETPSLLAVIEEATPELYDAILKRLGWDRMGPDLLRQLKMGII